MLAIVWAALLLEGCSAAGTSTEPHLSISSSTITKYSSVHATLSYTAGTITLPLDSYEMGWHDQTLIESANDILMDRCLRKSGYSNPLVNLDRESASEPMDRSFGVWVEASVAANGYNVPTNEVDEQAIALVANESTGWSKCRGRLQQFGDIPP
ncbi:MAG: hypothetical protein WDM88_09150 [Galbitalea sp.]